MAFVFCLALENRAAQKGEQPLDKDFLVKAATCNNAEIEISKLADNRSKSAQVKEFANTLVKDHKAAFEKTGELLKAHKLGVVTGLEKDTKDEISRLSKLEGAAFDQAFLQHMIQEHRKAISIVENQVKNGREADIRNHAKDMLPELQRHLNKAEELAKSSGK
jgi:putative membrane protein